ncbi:Imm30 family immunity protein [Hymenobacter terrenus]|uniref:Imm30 family immunity protein n=1 Tax=Hymenobacter terrenus TaxID=1629124 RepID=UPI000698CA87|nr:Imm30 family immunity protein [Hymenobacter terrenus]
MNTSVELAIQQLRDNRRMEADEQLTIFEEVLDQIAEDEDITNIPALCQGFDDDTDHSEVMWGLIHLIESYDRFSSRAEQLRYFLQGAPAMLPHAAEWLTTMLARVLNQDQARQALANELAASPPAVREPVVDVLRKLAAEDSERFATKVSEVLA